jgi:hypothetical protein
MPMSWMPAGGVVICVTTVNLLGIHAIATLERGLLAQAPSDTSPRSWAARGGPGWTRS